MTNPVSSTVYTQSTGSTSTNVFIAVLTDRDPTVADTKFPVQKRWINTSTLQEFILIGFTPSNGVLEANWKLFASVAGVVQSLAGNSGGDVPPDADGVINVVGDGTTVDTVGDIGTNTLTISAGIAGYPVTPFVVGPVGEAGYQTIQAGVNAANAAGGGIVVVQPGTYTENLTLYSNCHVMGLTLADSGGGVTIVGVHTPPDSGGFVFNNVALQSTTHIFSSAAAGSTHLIIANAAITVTNGYTFNLVNWTGKLETYDVNDRSSTNDGYINNTGGSEVAIFSSAVGAGNVNTMTLSGVTSIFSCDIGCPINFGTGSSSFLEYNVHTQPITLSDDSTGEIVGCELDTFVTMSSSAAWLISDCTINTANNPALDGSGAGTLTLGQLTFLNNSTIAGTLTISWGIVKPFATSGTTGTAMRGTAGFSSSHFTVADGFVELAGGGQGIDSIGVQATSGTGVDPVAPSAAGLIGINGATVAAQSIPVQSLSPSPNTLQIEIQRAAASVSTDTTSQGLSSFDSGPFAVDANGFVTMSSTAVSKFTQITVSGDFTKDSRTKWLKIIGWGGGGGGGSGRASPGGGDEKGGGGGGSCQGMFFVECSADTLDTTTSVTIGAGGAGGLGVDGTTDGNPGDPGGVTIFGNFETYSGAVTSAGLGGTGTAGGVGGEAPIIFYNGTAIQTTATGGNGGFSIASTGVTPGADVPSATGIGQMCPTGGGGGRGVTGPTGGIAAGGGNVTTWESSPTVILAGGVRGSGAGANASTVVAGGILCGGTGGGGAENVAPTPGGTGGIPGGGGGGGGPSQTGGAFSTPGGEGGRGEVWVFEYF